MVCRIVESPRRHGKECAEGDSNDALSDYLRKIQRPNPNRGWLSAMVEKPANAMRRKNRDRKESHSD